jgi:3-hydroxyisobutyrate dehydrogenase-like beta-hydroxyacid dehydrogenase
VSRIGFIGLGIMGKHMLRNLRKAGHELVAYDIVPALVDAVVGNGVERGNSCEDVASRVEVVFTMLPDGPKVEQVVLGPAGVLQGAHSGMILVDMSSISPLVSQKIAATCLESGVGFLDAPVSGGEPKAIDGTLAIMVGGDQATLVIARNFKPGFRIRLHQKDLRNALLTAESKKVALPLTSLVQQMLMALMNRGRGDLDHSAIVTFIEEMAPESTMHR